jgi:hypothetical protein
LTNHPQPMHQEMTWFHGYKTKVITAMQ